MRLSIDTPTLEMDEEQAAKLDRDNVAALRKTINATGVFILANVLSNTAGTISAGTEATLTGYDKAIVTSGGLVEFDFLSTVSVVAGVQLLFYLYIDDRQVASAGCAASTADIATFVNIRYKEQIGEGRHIVKILYTTAGTPTISYSDMDTRLLVTETKL